MRFESFKGHYKVHFKKEGGELWNISGPLGAVLKSIVKQTSIDVETIILSGYNVIQPSLEK